MATATSSSSSSSSTIACGLSASALPVAAAASARCDQSDADGASYSFDAECWPDKLGKERGTLAEVAELRRAFHRSLRSDGRPGAASRRLLFSLSDTLQSHSWRDGWQLSALLSWAEQWPSLQHRICSSAGDMYNAAQLSRCCYGHPALTTPVLVGMLRRLHL